MSFLESQSHAWDVAHWEFSLVFDDLADDDLWRRAHPRLLSIGEIVAHIVYGEVDRVNKLNPEFQIETPLWNPNASYYLTNVDQPLALDMSVIEIAAELDRVQKAAKEALLAVPAGPDAPAPPNGPGPTLGDLADYLVFHVAYHTGQAFSVRHLMGHKTNDN